MNRSNANEDRKLSQKIRELLSEKNETGVELLCKHFGPDARNFLRAKFSRSLNQIELDAAFNNALFKAWSYGHSIDVDQNLGAWFRRICNNEAFDLCRQMPKVSTCDFRQIGFVDNGVEDLTICNQRNPLAECLKSEIENLPNLQKRIVLADLQAGGEEHAVVLADRFETTANSIRVSRSKARKKLRLRLQHEYDPGQNQSLAI